MEITYHRKHDLLYIRLDPEAKQVRCRDAGEDIIVELADNDRIVGFEILDASKRVSPSSLPSIKYAEVA